MSASRAPEASMPFADLRTDEFEQPMRNLVNALLLYKSMFVGPWFTALGREEDTETRAAYERITDETNTQAHKAAELIRRWGAHQEQEAAVEVTDQVLTRLLEDMLELKKKSTEVFLAAGIRSPSEELRSEFLELARTDRQHADVLRGLLGIRIPKNVRRQAVEPPKGPSQGSQAGPFAPGTLSRKVREAVEDARAKGHEPGRLILSSEARRHLRDEGAVEPGQGNVFGMPTDLDFSWEGEAFAVTSRDTISLSEIVTEMAEDHESL